LWARIITDQIQKGEGFDRIHQVISVILLDYNMFPDKRYLRTRRPIRRACMESCRLTNTLPKL
jgi:hypothetical protein